MSTINDSTELSGMLGESVSVRKVNGRVVIKNRPRRRVATSSEKQGVVKSKFKEASQWASVQLANPDTEKLYADRKTSKMRSAFVVALTDYLTAPRVEEINVTRYTGKAGDLITAKAVDDFMVTEVYFTITDAAGKVIEQGAATQDAEKVFLWNYKSTLANDAIIGTKIAVVATDRPGNTGKLEKVI